MQKEVLTVVSSFKLSREHEVCMALTDISKYNKNRKDREQITDYVLLHLSSPADINKLLLNDLESL